MDMLNIKAISEITGVSAHTLRAWEKRYRAVEPKRISNSRRVYTIDEVERIRSLAFLVKHGHTISHIAHHSDDELTGLVDLVVRSAQKNGRDLNAQPADASVHSDDELARATQHLLSLLHDYRLSNINSELAQARVRYGAHDILFKIMTPLLNEIGMMVERNEISIAQEHAMSALLRNHLGEMIQLARIQSDRTPSGAAATISVVLATPEGNHHEFGIMMAQLLCTIYNIQTYYFGTSMPSTALGEATRAVKPTILLIGQTAVSRLGTQMPLGRYLREVDMQLIQKCEIWLGGHWDVNMDLLRLKNPVKKVGSLMELDKTLREMVAVNAH